MAATDTRAEHLEYQPHRAWYKRTDVVVPLVILLAGYILLVTVAEERSFFRTRVAPDGTENFDWMYFWHLTPLMWRGLLVTAKATVIGFSVAVVLGFLLALGRRSRLFVVRWPFALFIEFIRSTPLLVQLLFLQQYVRTADWITMRPFTILAVGLGIHYATYCSEAYRAGINSVPEGQWEAATALNLGPFSKWTRVIIPQAVPNVLPTLGNYLVAGFKDAPLGFEIAVPGILFFATTVRGVDSRDVEPLFMAGVGFLMASLSAAWLLRRLEKRIEYERT